MPTTQPRRPYLRRHFWVKSHRLWGWSICWYQWHPVRGWGIVWGIPVKELRQAKYLRRFLNARVGHYGSNTFEEAVRFVGVSDPKSPIYV